MSMHKVELTEWEREGLECHRLPIGKPSQLSDTFRAGVQFATKKSNGVIVDLAKRNCALQAKIDSPMLEFCPEEVTQDQIERWEESQVVSTWSANGKGMNPLLNLNPVSREIYGNNKFTKPNQHCYWDSDYQCWTEEDNHYRNRLKDMVVG